jgi:hypothetical protein
MDYDLKFETNARYQRFTYHDAMLHISSRQISKSFSSFRPVLFSLILIQLAGDRCPQSSRCGSVAKLKIE